MIGKEEVITQYQDFDIAFQGKVSYSVLSDKSIETIECFVRRFNGKFGHSAGGYMLFKYLCFQYKKWVFTGTDGKFKKPEIRTIFSAKSWESFLQRNREFDSLNESEVKKNLNISFNFYRKDEEGQKVNRAEEIIKARFKHDLDLKMSHCINFTTLYNPHSVHCITCELKEACKQIQQSTLPDICSSRKGGKNG